jgi:hypothetical protein
MENLKQIRHRIDNDLAEQYGLRLDIFELGEHLFEAEWYDLSDFFQDSQSKQFDNMPEAIFWLEGEAFGLITDRLMHEISVGKQAQDNLDIINRDGFVLEINK